MQLLELGGLLALLLLEEVDRLAPDDAGHDAVARRDRDALADELLGVPAAHADDVQVALVVDVRDDQADLVDVADDRDGRAVGLLAGDAREHAAHHVGRDVVTEPSRRLAPGRGGGGFVAGGAVGDEQ